MIHLYTYYFILDIYDANFNTFLIDCCLWGMTSWNSDRSIISKVGYFEIDFKSIIFKDGYLKTAFKC